MQCVYAPGLQKKGTPLLQELKHFAGTYPAYSAFRGLVSALAALHTLVCALLTSLLMMIRRCQCITGLCFPSCTADGSKQHPSFGGVSAGMHTWLMLKG